MALAAGGWPGGWTVLWVTAAMVGARTCAMATNRVVDRWIDADNGNGVGGPPTATWNGGTGNSAVINNNKGAAGAAACPYTTTNCGPNDEPFSLHTGGVHALMCDGAVKFISENTDIQVIRRASDPNDGEPVGEVEGLHGHGNGHCLGRCHARQEERGEEVSAHGGSMARGAGFRKV